MDYLKLIRVKHYIKNLLVFVPLACSGRLFEKGLFPRRLRGFVCFCLVASAVYIFNDIRDRESDAAHPTKKNRPIAGGRISVAAALAVLTVFTAAGILTSYLKFGPYPTAVLLCYALTNVLYSRGLKDKPIADVFLLAAGFLMRIWYGALVTGIRISDWLFLTVGVLSLYFALGKRRNEIKLSSGGSGRKVLKFYPVGFLDKSMTLTLTLAMTFYALWSRDLATEKLYGGMAPLITFPAALMIMLRYSMDIEGDSDGDPVEVLTGDKVLLGLCRLFAGIMFALLYLK